MRKIYFLLLPMIMLLVSCSQHRNLAYKFVKDNTNAPVALFLPESLVKINLRDDSIPEEMDTLPLQEKITFLESKIKVVDKIDDALFLDILYLSMVSTLNDYGLNVVASIDDSVSPYSPWIIDIPRIEVTELNDFKSCYGFLYDEEFATFVPIDIVNVAAWFAFSENPEAPIYFTEQNLFSDYYCSFGSDEQGRVFAKYYVDTISVADFYRLAENLGRLYAGYCYDAMLNEFIEKNSRHSPDTLKRFRYDPYERLFFKTDSDRLILVD
ncbi:MAG: hypothetical protein ACI358_00525 [Candidatus Limimorpha sp.]